MDNSNLRSDVKKILLVELYNSLYSWHLHSQEINNIVLK